MDYVVVIVDCFVSQLSPNVINQLTSASVMRLFIFFLCFCVLFTSRMLVRRMKSTGSGLFPVGESEENHKHLVQALTKEKPTSFNKELIYQKETCSILTKTYYLRAWMLQVPVQQVLTFQTPEMKEILLLY